MSKNGSTPLKPGLPQLIDVLEEVLASPDGHAKLTVRNGNRVLEFEVRWLSASINGETKEVNRPVGDYSGAGLEEAGHDRSRHH